MFEALHLELPATPGSLSRLRPAVEQALRAAGGTDEEIFEFVVSVNEAAANAIVHAYEAGPAIVSVSITRDAGGAVVARVRDHGRWREPERSREGRGVRLMRAFSDSVELHLRDDGTETVLRRRLGESVPS